MIELPIGIESYAEQHSKPMSLLHEKLWLETYRKTGSPEKTVGPLEAQFLKMLVLMTGARRLLEIGTFTGYSTLAFAEALPRDGRIVSCEIDTEIAGVAKSCLLESPHAGKIEIRQGPALASLRVINGPFDLCFIDADGENYKHYYERCLELVRAKGVIVLDNMLRGGSVVETSDPSAQAIDALNKRIRKDPRVENVLLPVRNGIMLVIKR